MAEPTPKAPAIEALLNEMSGRTPAIKTNRCVMPPIGCDKPATEFRDELSRREYRICVRTAKTRCLGDERASDINAGVVRRLGNHRGGSGAGEVPMKMAQPDYDRLAAVLPRFMLQEAAHASHSLERQRWDAYWMGTTLDQRRLLDDYLNDNHIDTALRRIQKESLIR